MGFRILQRCCKVSVMWALGGGRCPTEKGSRRDPYLGGRYVSMHAVQGLRFR